MSWTHALTEHDFAFQAAPASLNSSDNNNQSLQSAARSQRP